MNIFTIPKNASQTLTNIRNVITGSDIDVVVIREPLDRFISAAKTIHPKYGIFGGFPPTYKDMPWRRGHFTDGAVAEEFIDHAISCLGQYQYVQTQASIIGDRKFDEVLKFDTFVEDIQQIVKKYNMSVSGNGVFDIHHHNSPHQLDRQMYTYTKDKYMSVLQDYFAIDYKIYASPQLLYKHKKML